MLRITTILICTLSVHICNAQVYWNGGSGKWSEAQKWSTGIVPATTDSVVIDTEDARVTISNNDPKIKAVYLGFRAELEIDFGQSLFISGGGGNAFTSLSGKIINHGVIEISKAAKNGMVLNGRNEFNLSRLTNNGSILIQESTAGGLLAGQGVLVNNGTINSIRNGGSGYSIGHSNGLDMNNGILISKSNGAAGIVTRSREFINSGTISIDDNSTGLQVIGGAMFNNHRVDITDSDLQGLLVHQSGAFSNDRDTALVTIRLTNGNGINVDSASISNRGIINVISSTSTGMDFSRNSSYVANGSSLLIIDNAASGISLSGNSNMAIRSSVIINNCSRNAIRQFGNSSMDFLPNSNLNITNIVLSACRLFDTSELTFYETSSFTTDMITGTDVFLIADNAVFKVDEGVEVNIGL